MRYSNQQRQLWYSRNNKSLYGYIIFYHGPHVYFNYSM